MLKNYKDVLIIRFSSLGDIVLTFKAVEALKKQGGAIRIHYLTKEKFKSILEINPFIEAVHTIPDHASISDLINKSKELASRNFDIVYDFHNNIRSKLLSLIFMYVASHVSIKKLKKRRISELVLFCVKRRLFKKLFSNTLDRSSAFLALIEGENKFSSKLIEFLNKDIRNINEHVSFDKSSRYVAIAPESLWKEKEWGHSNFIQTSERLTNEGYKVIWLGLNPIEKIKCSEHVIDLTGKTKLAEIPWIISKCELLLCNDSGLMHISEAVGVPVAAIFGPTSPELGFAPKLNDSVIIQDSLWCRPCSKSGKYCFRLVHKQKCLSNISVDQVMSSVHKMLNKGSRVQPNENMDI